MRRIALLLFCATILLVSALQAKSGPTIAKSFKISKSELLNKVKGGWAGQTIGCTYGGPTEFKYCGTMIQEYVPITWSDRAISGYYDIFPGLYDDVYMDVTFVDVFNRLGIDAHVDSLAMAFATAPYPLWHANQAARYNILNGIMPPASGHWHNNPHADDIDYQIEADYAGLMSPGMPNSASEISDKVGHIMNYGDGLYGGIYVGAMYSLAFISNDVEFIVTEALKTIPVESKYHKCMSDVIKWHKEYPNDWKRTWFECERKWSSDIGCPDGVFVPLNIDAVINSAYIVIGLLYGEGDFYKTLDISTRCGQDSDCNPASAVGIIGTMLGYDKIPQYWMGAMRAVEDRKFEFPNVSLNRVYEMSFDQALQMVKRGGGSVNGNEVIIKCQQPIAVPMEEAFKGHYPIGTIAVNKEVANELAFAFEGIGIVMRHPYIANAPKGYVAEVEVVLDGKSIEIAKMPMGNDSHRRLELFWKYELPNTKHNVVLKWLNPKDGVMMRVGEALIYSDKPVVAVHK